MDLDTVLENDCVRMAPVTAADRQALSAIAFDPRIWTWTVKTIATPAELDAYIDDCVVQRERGVHFTFTIRDAGTGALAGASALGNYSAKDRRVEIGWTWLAPQFWGTKANAGAKAALLGLCFERLGLQRVEFKTDVRNLRARAALKKIGCTEEGILRSHTLMHDGRRRDTIYYSILRDEWPNTPLARDPWLRLKDSPR